MISNRVAVVRYGAAKRCQGCRQIWNYCLFIDVLQQRVPLIVIFNPAWVPPNNLKDLKGAVKQKKVEKHWLKVLFIGLPH